MIQSDSETEMISNISTVVKDSIQCDEKMCSRLTGRLVVVIKFSHQTVSSCNGVSSTGGRLLSTNQKPDEGHVTSADQWGARWAGEDIKIILYKQSGSTELVIHTSKHLHIRLGNL